jgi:hypothetical protein
VADNFSTAGIARRAQGLDGVGHVRYSTTGGAGLRNVQPLFADLASGGFAVAHNGNISNALHLKREMVEEGRDLPVDLGHRGDHPPRRHQPVQAHARQAGRRAAAGRRAPTR